MFSSIQELKQEIEESQGVLTVQMSALRDAHGVDRLGKIVIENISKELAGEGLGHYPTPLPLYQHLEARIYKRGSRVEDIIKAVFTVGEDNDEVLRTAATGEEAELLNQIRGLLCG